MMDGEEGREVVGGGLEDGDDGVSPQHTCAAAERKRGRSLCCRSSSEQRRRKEEESVECLDLDVLDLGAVAGGGVAGLLVGVVGGPEREVVAEELHDERAVLVGLLGEGVEFGDGVVEGLLGDVAGAVRGREDFVVEDAEVEGQAQTDGVRRRQGLGGDLGRDLVRFERFARRRFSLVGGLELGEVPVVVAFHFVVEDLAFVARRDRNEFLVNDGQDVFADLLQLRLDLRLVVRNQRRLVRVRLLLDARDHAPRRPTRPDHVLVRHRQQVPLLHTQLLLELRHALDVLHHLVEPLRLKFFFLSGLFFFLRSIDVTHKDDSFKTRIHDDTFRGVSSRTNDPAPAPRASRGTPGLRACAT
mmetsp:Transcript_26473/g.81413  ORF Transcript_26473/g.81413 Transcript_26473/m.81413 type:complete len:358 (+) Transcript_26473:535-1608(+)